MTRNRLLKTAMRVCDLWGDGVNARKSMQKDIETLPEAHLQELYSHFVETYNAFKGKPNGYLKKGSIG